MNRCVNLLTSLSLALALSIDSLSVGFLYAARGIRLSYQAMAIVSLTSAALLGLAMGTGTALAGLLSPAPARWLGAILLVLVGFWVLFQTWWQNLWKGSPGDQPRMDLLTIPVRPLGVVIQIIRTPSSADLDRSGYINPTEALWLGLALAVDSVGAGIGAALSGFNPVTLAVAVAVIGFGCLSAGAAAAYRLPWKLKGNWAFLHGFALVVLGLTRLF